MCDTCQGVPLKLTYRATGGMGPSLFRRKTFGVVQGEQKLPIPLVSWCRGFPSIVGGHQHLNITYAGHSRLVLRWQRTLNQERGKEKKQKKEQCKSGYVYEPFIHWSTSLLGCGEYRCDLAGNQGPAGCDSGNNLSFTLLIGTNSNTLA